MRTILLAIGTLLILWFGSRIFIPVDLPSEGIELTIEGGTGVREIARLLNERGVIKGTTPFILYAVVTGNAQRLQAGEYTFEGSLAPYEVVDLVSSGFSLSSQATVTIPEGFTVRQIEARLKEAELSHVSRLSEERPQEYVGSYEFLRTAGTAAILEGFLFPDTYTLDKESTNSVVLSRMLQNFDEKTMELRREAESRSENFYDVLILASILEREVPERDMPRAAGVLAKRLSAGMALQADATLVYGLGRPIRTADTRTFDSPFNTYLHRGLPPTPISNPGLSAMRAALDPEENEYWFYLSRPDTGETVFSRTFEEHSRARAQHLQ
jgi:UPF0755 protein